MAKQRSIGIPDDLWARAGQNPYRMDHSAYARYALIQQLKRDSIPQASYNDSSPEAIASTAMLEKALK